MQPNNTTITLYTFLRKYIKKPLFIKYIFEKTPHVEILMNKVPRYKYLIWLVVWGDWLVYRIKSTLLKGNIKVNVLISVLYTDVLTPYLLFINDIFLQLKRRLELLQREYERTAQRLQVRVDLYRINIKPHHCPVLTLSSFKLFLLIEDWRKFNSYNDV